MDNEKRQYHLTQDGKDLFKGKTIERVESSACNHWRFIFTDGTESNVWSESFAHGVTGMITLEK